MLPTIDTTVGGSEHLMNLLVRNVRLIDGRGASARQSASVEVKGGLITWIGDDHEIGRRAAVMDARWRRAHAYPRIA